MEATKELTRTSVRHGVKAAGVKKTEEEGMEEE